MSVNVAVLMTKSLASCLIYS